MQGKATIGGHPIHPMLIPFPIGFFVGAVVCDIVFAVTRDPFWPPVSVVMLGFGIVGALLAAVAGFVDYLTAPMSPRAKSTGTLHMVLNLLAVVLFAIAFWLRRADAVSTAGITMTVLGVIVLAVGGYLGGHLSYHHGIGVDERSADRAVAGR